MAQAIIAIMGNMNPHLRDIVDFKHKLWDHLAVISEFDLDIDAFNQTSVTDRENLTWDESLEAFELSFKSFEEGLNEIPVTRFRTEGGFKSWLTAMIHEYQFHLPHIQHAQSL